MIATDFLPINQLIMEQSNFSNTHSVLDMCEAKIQEKDYPGSISVLQYLVSN